MYVLEYQHGKVENKECVSYYEHTNAVVHNRTDKHGRAIMDMLKAWEAYREAYYYEYERSLDYVIGPYWAQIGLDIKRLLDGEVGGLDRSSICQNITRAIEKEGMKTDGYELLESTE